jgi:hypothetical protein
VADRVGDEQAWTTGCTESPRAHARAVAGAPGPNPTTISNMDELDMQSPVQALQ